MTAQKKKKQEPGPEADRLKINEDDWEAAVRKAIKEQCPKEGWPKPETNKDSE